ncbi:MAG: hypothetical protein R3253_15145 [Longimicrobiales bacterium]|nr:hypothetical protein [Longimicrobiales bacterium]
MDDSDSAAPSLSTGGASSTGDLLYDAFYGGAIGGAATALFFLAVDVFAAEPLYTPSLLGTVLFTGADPASVTEVRLDMVAYFSAVHLVAFLILGGAVSYLCRLTGISETNLPVVTGVVFVVLSAAFFAGDFLVMQGVAAAIGIPFVLGANFVTALAMAVFLRKAHTG